MTSLTFMLDWVPDPVCHTNSGKCSSSCPSMTSPATRPIRSAIHPGSRPPRPLTVAAACLTYPSARHTVTGIRSSPMEKCTSDRWVCAPQ